jgi:hypothetical protein
MESTSVYSISFYQILEAAGFEMFLVNAQYVKYVPGRKTDISDCQWIQYLRSVGLLSYKLSTSCYSLRHSLSLWRHRESLIQMGALTRSPHAEVTQSDEPATSSRAERNHWFERAPYPRRDLSGTWNGARSPCRPDRLWLGGLWMRWICVQLTEPRAANCLEQAKSEMFRTLIEGLAFMDRILQDRYAV